MNGKVYRWIQVSGWMGGRTGDKWMEVWMSVQMDSCVGGFGGGVDVVV